MKLKKQKTKVVFSFVVVLSVFFGNLGFKAQDVVPNDELSLGSSVFVFRQSRKKPQSKSTSQNYFLRNASVRTSVARRSFNKNLAASYRKKSAQSKINSTVTAKNQASRRKAAAVSRNKLSETLTAQADGLLQNGETDKAIGKYKEALKSNLQNQNAKLGLSEAYVAKGDEVTGTAGSAVAKTFYQEAVKLDESNSAAYIKLALADEDANLNDDALVNYEKALKINPASPELFIPVANLYYEKGDLTAAETYLAKAEKVAGSNADSVLLRGLIYSKRGENEKAFAAFAKTLELDPNRAEVYFHQAEIYDRLNQPQKAAAAYEKTIEIDPRYIEAWFDLGVSYYNQGQYEKAVDAYKQVIVLDANHPDAHANLASAYRQLERYGEANGEYKIAADYIKNDADLFSEWGFCLGKVDEWDKSIARLQTAKELNPDSIDYTNLGWAYYNAAQTDAAADKNTEAQAKYAQGKTVLQKAVELNPRFDAAFLNLGITYTGLGDYQNAVESLTKANSLHANWVIAVNELGVAYRRLDKLPDAISQFQRAVSLDDKFALGYFNLGEAQNKLGRKKEAKQTLEKLKKLNPELANRLNSAMKGAATDEMKDQIRKRIPKFPL